MSTSTAPLASALERLLPALWSSFTPLPPGGFADLPVGQARVLSLLTLTGRRRVGELAEELGVRVPTITGIVDRLEERGLVARSRCAEDGRVVWVAAQPAGERLAEANYAARREAIAAKLERLEPPARAALLEALVLLEEALAEPAGVGAPA
jgi:DNA-binding MarR family transcriptional regulator